MRKTALRVAIVDDDVTRRRSLFFTLEDVGFEPLEIGDASNLERTIEEIADKADTALCDHRLSKNGYAPYRGAQLVAELSRRGIPAVLITAFQSDDVEIRRLREFIPQLIIGDEATDPDLVKTAIDEAVAEIDGSEVPSSRQTFPAFFRVEDLEDEGTAVVVYGFVPQWSEEIGISFPLDLVPPEFREAVKRGATLSVSMNLNAAEANDVFLRDIAPVPAEGADPLD